MSADLDVDTSLVKYLCPIGKEGCPGPIVMQERGQTYFVCHQVMNLEHAPQQVIAKCGDELPALLFMSFMQSKGK